MKVQIA